MKNILRIFEKTAEHEPCESAKVSTVGDNFSSTYAEGGGRGSKQKLRSIVFMTSFYCLIAHKGVGDV